MQKAVSRIGRGVWAVAGALAPLDWPVHRAAARSMSAGCGDGKRNACARGTAGTIRASLHTAPRTGGTDARRHDQCGDEQERVGHAHLPAAERSRPACPERACHYREHAVLTSVERGHACQAWLRHPALPTVATESAAFASRPPRPRNATTEPLRVAGLARHGRLGWYLREPAPVDTLTKSVAALSPCCRLSYSRQL
jgi:hypothetical protein